MHVLLATVVLSAALAFDYDKDTLVNIHIPKAGGTAFEVFVGLMLDAPPCTYANNRSMLWRDKCCGGKSLLRTRYHPRMMECPRHVYGATTSWLQSRLEKSSGWAAGVHAGFARYRQWMQGQPTSGRVYYIAMVREPLNRTVSEYHQSYNGWNPRRVVTLPRDLLCSGDELPPTPPCSTKLRRGFSNWMMCARGDTEWRHRQARMLADNLGCRDNVHNTRQSDAKLLQSANNTIWSETVLVGVYERLFESIAFFEDRTSLRFDTRTIRSLHREPAVHVLPGHIRERLSLLEHVDRAVYKEANRHLDAATRAI